MSKLDYPINLRDRTFLITGASSGIGRAAAIIISRLGAKIICTGRNTERLKETTGLLKGEGHKIEPFDLRDLDQIPGWMESICSPDHLLNGFVHAAGVRHITPIRLLRPEKWRDDIKIGAESALYLTKAFLNSKVYAGEKGSIVFISSVLGFSGSPGEAVYSYAKGALIGLTRSLALELAPNKIRVNCIAPAAVETPMHLQMDRFLNDEQRNRLKALHPLGIGQPEDVAHAVVFLLADTARWITGSVLVVDGGYSAQ